MPDLGYLLPQPMSVPAFQGTTLFFIGVAFLALALVCRLERPFKKGILNPIIGTVCYIVACGCFYGGILIMSRLHP